MLNLSDNELDRLSREAASQHDPGDLMGPQAWERLELRLDKELGRAGPDASRGSRGFRRLPFQYVPAILLIVGVSYYFIKQAIGRKAEHSGSPPLTIVKTPQQPGTMASDSSLNNPAYRDKSTSTPYHEDQSQNTDPSASDGAATGKPSGSSITPTSPAGSSGHPGSSGTSKGSVAPSGSSATADGSGASAGSTTPTGSSGASARSSRPPGSSGTSAPSTASSGSSKPTGISGTSTGSSRPPGSSGASTGSTRPPGSSGTSAPSTALSGSSKPPGSIAGLHNNTSTNRRHHTPNRSGANGQLPNNTNKQGASLTDQSATPSGITEPSGPEWSFVQRAHSLRNHPNISDSALRAFTIQTPTNPGKKSGPSLRINRPLTFGLLLAPDFSSVNALAGDKPGSSVGITIDYQLLNRLHLGTGILFSRKNYTARGTDYHVPWNYYQAQGIKKVDFVKGTLNMMEIPINLRYDFSITGNTIFFASGGVSTYLFGNENCNYYYDWFGREVCRKFDYTNKHSVLSSANLSLGVETGISNDFSIMVAPYMKLPLSDIGFGKIRMNSVGINVSLRYSPVLSRKRQH